MNTQQLRAEAVSRKKSLLMTIRMNKCYLKYNKKQKRLEKIKKAEQELANLEIPEVKKRLVGFSFEYPNGDWIGAVYGTDFEDAKIEAAQDEGTSENDIRLCEKIYEIV